MYTAEQINYGIYIPDATDTRNSMIERRIMLDAIRGQHSSRFRISADYPKVAAKKFFESKGYVVSFNVFLDNEYMTIGW